MRSKKALKTSFILFILSVRTVQNLHVLLYKSSAFKQHARRRPRSSSRPGRSRRASEKTWSSSSAFDLFAQTVSACLQISRYFAGKIERLPVFAKKIRRGELELQKKRRRA